MGFEKDTLFFYDLREMVSEAEREIIFTIIREEEVSLASAGKNAVGETPYGPLRSHLASTGTASRRNLLGSIDYLLDYAVELLYPEGLQKHIPVRL